MLSDSELEVWNALSGVAMNAKELAALLCNSEDGLLRTGESMNVITTSKTGKSWLVSDLAITLAAGRAKTKNR